VHEGRVLLTGKANSQETVIEVVNIAWGIVGVREVINELRVDARDQPDSYAKDAVISGQVKSRLFLEKNINSVNYTVETVDGVVYMMGIAQDQIELERAAAVAATTSGVRKVVSHVRLKDSEYRR
jgi:osmotically-inducible protein OsmY